MKPFSLSSVLLVCFISSAPILADQTVVDDPLDIIRTKAEQGNVNFELMFALAYQLGMYNLPKDHEEAAKWYLKAADQGDKTAQEYLANAYHDGDGVHRDAAEVAKWYQKAADQGSIEAQDYLAISYLNGDGVEKNIQSGIVWLRKVLAMDDSKPILDLPSALDKAASADDKNTVRIKWAKQIIIARAQFTMGWLFHHGEGVPENMTTAIEWWRKAADRGNASALYSLGDAYCDGRTVPYDATTAVNYFQKAADKGDLSAQYRLGGAYAHGAIRLPKDYVAAYKWFNLAAANGLEAAANERDSLEHLMTAEQIAEAQRLTRDFVPSG